MIMLVLGSVLAAQEENSRQGRFLFQFGGGPNFPFYDSATETLFSAIDAQAGVTRTKLALDLEFGYGLSPTTMFLAGMIGTGDALSYGGNTMQLNLYLYHLGLRWYPGAKGFYLSGLVGATKGLLMLNGSALSGSNFGTGAGLAIGNEFSSRNRGFTVGLEAATFGGSIEGQFESTVMVTLNLAWR